MSQYDTDDAPRLGGGQKLSLLDAVAQSIGFVGPVFSIAFLVPLLVGLTSASGRGAGNAAPLAVVLASIGVLALGWIISEYARRISAAGSLYDYISDGLGSRFGGTFGLLYYVGILALGSGLAVMIGGTIHDTLDAEFGSAVLPEGLWDLVVIGLVGAILYFGVAFSTRAQLVLALLSVATVFLFSLYVIVKAGGDNDLGKALSPSSSETGFSGVLFGVLYGVLLFTGFETSANLGEETEHPKRDIPRAVLISVLLVAGFYFIATYAQVAGFKFDLGAMGDAAGGPLFALASGADDGGFGSTAVRRLLELVVVLDMLAVLIGCAVAASRGLFALARDRRLPSALANVSPRSTPLNATIVVLGLYLLTTAVTLWVPGFVELTGPDGAPLGLPHYVSVFSWMAALGGFSLAVIYLVLSVGAVRGLADHAQPWKVYLAVFVSILVTGAAIFGAIYKVPAPTIYVVWTTLAVFVVSLVLAFVSPGVEPSGHEWDDLNPADQGPQKL
ncbi:MAG: APC family permease [Actinobacteria bacterium]|nr:APC family permease [Actinomycetota bacterium]